MAESYLITIKFAADNSTTKQTEKKLNSVFDRCTKRFKQGLGKVGDNFKRMFTLGGAAAGLSLVLTRLLAPLSELNDKINATLSRARDIKTRAQGYGTEVATYTALEGFANSAGIRPEVFHMMMSRLQSGIAEAAAGEKNALQAYAGDTDIGKSMYNLMNSLAEEADPNKRAQLAKSIFGERALVQLQPLLTNGFKGLEKFTEKFDADAYTKAIDKLASLENQQSELAFIRDINDMIKKSETITEETIKEQDKNAKARLAFENDQIKAYKSLSTLDTQLITIQTYLLQIVDKIGLLTKPLEGLGLLGSTVKDAIEDPKSHLAVISRSLQNALPVSTIVRKVKEVVGGGK